MGMINGYFGLRLLHRYSGSTGAFFYQQIQQCPVAAGGIPRSDGTSQPTRARTPATFGAAK
jgi:hypothetical protein